MRHAPLLAGLAGLAGLAAVLPDAEAGAVPPPYPQAPVVVREQCFGPTVREPYGSVVPIRGAPSGSVGTGYGGGPPRAGAAAPAADAALAPSPPAPAPEREAARKASPSVAPEAASAYGPPPPPHVPRTLPAPRGPSVDFGGVVHLSNDDSMSLASAQRLLWAVERDAPIPLEHIRPHELLNYFTFDPAPPAPGRTFGVAASAVRVDTDTLALGLVVQAAKPPRAPLDLTILVDRSGSMSAEGRMDYTRRALHLAADRLQPGDRVDVVLFDHEACTPLQDFVVGRDDPALLRHTLDRIQPRGSTDLDLGLREAYAVARTHTEPGRAGRVMVFTDAILNTGRIDPHVVTEIGRALDRDGIRLTGVGVGSDFRDDVLDRLTEKGKGAYVFLGSERVVDRLFGSGFDALVQTVAHDVRYELDLPDSLGMVRFYGEESSTRAEDVAPVHVHAGSRQLFLQDLRIRDGRLVPSDPVRLTISWEDPITGQRRAETFVHTVGQALAADPHSVHKGRALMAWTDVLTARALGQDACGVPFATFRSRLADVRGDAEVAWAAELLGRWCGTAEPVAAWTAPSYTRVRLDTDVPIDEVALTCGGTSERKLLTASDQVASFTAPPGTCDLTLYGTVPMTARVEVPATGVDLRCTVRGGRLACR